MSTNDELTAQNNSSFTFSKRELCLIVRIQAVWRGLLSRKRVQELRSNQYSPGMGRFGNLPPGTQDFNNANVQVT